MGEIRRQREIGKAWKDDEQVLAEAGVEAKGKGKSPVPSTQSPVPNLQSESQSQSQRVGGKSKHFRALWTFTVHDSI